jgi:hypothetical protein
VNHKVNTTVICVFHAAFTRQSEIEEEKTPVFVADVIPSKRARSQVRGTLDFAEQHR